ncbi:MAG: dihydroorotase [Cytophagales bacterium]|nr:dihydroorotase [Cytophagales bacterium]
MNSILIVNAKIVNEGKVIEGDVFVKQGRIESVAVGSANRNADKIIDANGSYLLPGVIDDQVHFREPGLTHKGDIYTESRAAVAGGITSFMEMPNTVPNTVTQDLLAEKYKLGERYSLANYSFYFGATNDNIEEVLKTNSKNVCGIKIFMGSSTGNMLVDDLKALENIFSKVEMLIATHCEDEATIRRNSDLARERFGEDVPFEMHPDIRSREACYLSSSKAVELAKKNNTKLHILHISTENELELFDNSKPLEQKRITSEACIHHLWFDRDYYKHKGSLIKWNPAVKEARDKAAIFDAVLNDEIDVLATDHAPHTLEEKRGTYFNAPSGGPLVQHSLVAAVEFVKSGKMSMEKLVEKMCHNPAVLFQIDSRGYIREGYHADLVIVDPNYSWVVDKSNILYKCGWSPFEGHRFSSQVTHTIVSGHLAYDRGKFDASVNGSRLLFDG